MAAAANFLLAVILFIVWIIAGVFITDANVKLTSLRNLDDNLHKAYWYSFWAAFLTWFIIAAAIIIVIAVVVLGVVFGGEILAATSSSGVATSDNISALGSWTAFFLLLVALVLIIITGILSSFAAANLERSPNTNHSDATYARINRDCIISACACLGAAGILIIAVIASAIAAAKRAAMIAEYNELKEKIKAHDESKIRNLNDLQQEVLRAQIELKLAELKAQTEVSPAVVNTVTSANTVTSVALANPSQIPAISSTTTEIK